jgi:hypothetical protein
MTFESIVHFAPDLAEIRQSGCFHPNDEMLILDINPAFSWLIIVLEFRADIIWPSDPSLDDFDFIKVPVVNLETVVEEASGDQTTRNCSFV